MACPVCGHGPLTYYESAKQLYCPKKAGGCGAFGRLESMAAYEASRLKNACGLCGEPCSGEWCRTCRKWASACEQCDEPWRHSHIVERLCRYPSCGQRYLTRKQWTPDREKQWCSDRCKRNHDKREYAKRKKAASRTESKWAREKQGRVSFDVVTLTLLVQQGYRCSLCGELVDLTLPWQDAMALTADHTIPLADGGSDDPSNLTAAHRACNSRKGWSRGNASGMA